MSVYVDNMYQTSIGRMGRMKMSHMLADTTEELHEMADRLGLKRAWCQYEGTPTEHYDVSMAKRKQAVELGAIEITMRDAGRIVAARRSTRSDGHSR